MYVCVSWLVYIEDQATEFVDMCVCVCVWGGGGWYVQVMGLKSKPAPAALKLTHYRPATRDFTWAHVHRRPIYTPQLKAARFL